MKVTNLSPAPVQRNTTEALRRRAGISDNEFTPQVRQVVQSLTGEVDSLKAELHASRARIGELEQLADTDPLSGVLNRRGFVRELNRAIAMSDRHQTPSSLVFADLNDLKVINDNFGHAAGDAALSHVAAALSANVRKTDAVGRLGGDEFAVILTQTDPAAARAKAKALAENVAAKPVEWSGVPFNASISVGTVEISKGATAEHTLAAADQAMYAVKRRR